MAVHTIVLSDERFEQLTNEGRNPPAPIFASVETDSNRLIVKASKAFLDLVGQDFRDAKASLEGKGYRVKLLREVSA